MRTKPGRTILHKICCLVLAALVTGCAAQPGKPDSTNPTAATHSGTVQANTAAVPASSASQSTPNGAESYPSTYKAPASSPTLIRAATVLTGTGTRRGGRR